MGATPDKLKITAYMGTGDLQALSKNAEDTYTALVNPETYAIQYQIVLQNKCVPGSSGNDPNYVYTPVPNLQFDFLFDATGVIPKPKGVIGDIPVVGAVAGAISNLISPSEEYEVMNEINKFKKVLFTYEGANHSPKRI